MDSVAHYIVHGVARYLSSLPEFNASHTRNKCTITAQRIFNLFGTKYVSDFKDPRYSFVNAQNHDLPERLQSERKRVVLYFDINAGDDGHRFVVFGEWSREVGDMVYVLMQSNANADCGPVFSICDSFSRDKSSFVIGNTGGFAGWWKDLIDCLDTNRDCARLVRLPGPINARLDTSRFVTSSHASPPDSPARELVGTSICLDGQWSRNEADLPAPTL